MSNSAPSEDERRGIVTAATGPKGGSGKGTVALNRVAYLSNKHATANVVGFVDRNAQRAEAR